MKFKLVHRVKSQYIICSPPVVPAGVVAPLVVAAPVVPAAGVVAPPVVAAPVVSGKFSKDNCLGLLIFAKKPII